MARRVLSLGMPRLASDLALRRLGDGTGPFAGLARLGLRRVRDRDRTPRATLARRNA